MRLLGAVDVGGTKTAVALAREDGTILAREQWPTEPARGFTVAAERVRKALFALPSGGDLAGIGIACPGPLEAHTGRLGMIGTLPGWQDCNLAAELQDAFNLPTVIENDADAAALAEYKWGSGRGSKRFLYITVSTGIGSGFVLAGKLDRGSNGAHAEIGHLLIDSSGPLCYCGAHGCWEALASGTAMSEWLRSESSFALELTAEQICVRAAHGEPLALRAVEREAYYLGLGLANVLTAFIPDTICLGGGVMKSSSLFLEQALETMRGHCTQVPHDRTKITLATLGADAGVLGAAAAWLSRYS